MSFRGTLFLFCCMPLWAAGQRSHVSPPPDPQYTITHYTDENGLPQNSIKDMARDSYGFVWLASEAGLIRYDGKQFQLFSKEEMGTLHARIYLMGRWTHTGQLFAMTEGEKYVHVQIDGCRPVFTDMPAFLSDSSTRSYYGAALCPAVTKRFSMFSEEYQKSVLVHASADSFFVVSRTNQAYTVEFGTPGHKLWTVKVPPKKEKLSLYWQNKSLYFYTASGVFYSVSKSGFRQELAAPRFKKLIWNRCEDQSFILTEDDVLYSLAQNQKGRLSLQPFFKNVPFGFEVETALYLKQEDIVLLGSMRNGLLVCKKQGFKTLFNNLPGHESVFYGIHPFDEKTLITGDAELLNRNGHIGTARGYRHRKNPNHPSIARNAQGYFFINSRDSILVYTHDAIFKRSIPLHNLEGVISADQEGTIWATCRDSGIYAIGEDMVPRKTIMFDHPLKITFVKELIDGMLFIGSDNGLYLYNKNSKVLNHFPHTEKYYIRSIFLSVRDKIYLCTYGDGIIMLDHDGLVPLPADKRGHLKMAHCMLQDKKGRLWVTTNKGLFAIPEIDLVRYAEGKNRYVYYYYFGKENGFGTNEFNGGCQPCGVRMASGEMVFPSLNGLVFFNPDSIRFNFPEKKLQIKEVAVNDTSIGKVNDTVNVARDFKRIEIFLTTPLFDSDQNLFVEYSLDSSQSDSWAPIPLNGPLTFTSVPSGHSTITFRLNAGFGMSNYSYRSFTIYKPEAFWEWTVFWPTVFVLLLLSVYIYLRVRTRNLNERNKLLSEAVDMGRRELMVTINSLTETSHELERKNRFQQWLISSVVHDLRGPLRFIKFYGDIKKEDEVPTAEKYTFLKSVYFSAQKIYTYSENLIQLLRIEQNTDFPPQKTDFAKLVDEKIEQFQEQIKWNGVGIVLDPDSDPFIHVNATALSIIIQNLLDNSVKNLKDGNIYLLLRNEESHAVIEIRDEGPGLTPELLQKFNRPGVKDISGGHSSGIGLWLVKSLVQQTGGSILFQNIESGGLLITLSWPAEAQNAKVPPQE